MVREILKAVSIEIVKGVNSQVEYMSGVSVGITRAVVRCCDYDFGAGLRNSMHLSHDTQNIGLMLEKV